ncbi:AQP9 [Bugula neritina]|uniref:AQP9 n=1 Tax=Bugula neritina TaxID=10212 RepID=A0A7J7K7N7_BUGNE|nr:AQP9 [Bugula neritina]
MVSISALKIKSYAIRVAFAEFLGTCILLVIGLGSIVQSVTSHTAYGTFTSTNWAWGMAVMFKLTVTLLLGGHINPAISLAMAVIGRLQWKLLPVYMLAQYLGAFVGTAIVYLVYFEAIENYSGGVKLTDPTLANSTAGIFSTYPQEFLSVTEGLADQIVGTMMLLLPIMAITDRRNADVPKFLVPVLVGLAVFAIGAAYGYNCGAAINPARDLSPRIFTALAGWGTEVFSFRNYNWFWVPIVGPHIGAILGAIIYLFLVELHWDSEDELSNDFPPGDSGEIKAEDSGDTTFL